MQGMDASTVFEEVHNPAYLWADSYGLFERIMDLGIKELYYKDNTTVKVTTDNI